MTNATWNEVMEHLTLAEECLVKGKLLDAQQYIRLAAKAVDAAYVKAPKGKRK